MTMRKVGREYKIRASRGHVVSFWDEFYDERELRTPMIKFVVFRKVAIADPDAVAVIIGTGNTYSRKENNILYECSKGGCEEYPLPADRDHKYIYVPIPNDTKFWIDVIPRKDTVETTVYIEWLVYDGVDAIIANKLLSTKKEILPENIDGYRRDVIRTNNTSHGSGEVGD